ncbi:MAG: EAL domain-containing protein [Eubacterium sp.]|nr:EAL domain-containing protein [Eubacterium sp.]
MFNYSFSLGVALSSLLICIVNLIYTIIQKRTDKLQNRLFIAVLCILMVNSMTAIVSSVYGFKPELIAGRSFALHASRYAYFLTHTALCPLFFYYSSNVSFASTRLTNRKIFLLSLPFFVTELLVIINPFTNLVWSLDQNLEFHREWAEILIYIAALFYYVLAFHEVIRTWDCISRKRRISLIFLFIMVAVGVIVQLLNKDLKVEILAEAIGFTGVMMSVENEDDRIDIGSGFYNRTALTLDIGGCLKNGRKLKLLLIRIQNSDLVNRLIGTGEANTIADILSDYLRSVVPRYDIYIPEKDTFILTLYNLPDAEAEAIAERVAGRFEQPWEYREYSIQLSASLILSDIPTQIKSTAELAYMIDSPMSDSTGTRVLKGNDLRFVMRRHSIEDALSRGFAENSYEVYFQPTYHINRKLHGAEALIRMHDKELGNLYPDEFIPIAEQNGLIDDIDEFVLEEVCRFLQTGVPAEHGIDNININLSVLQCMRPGFVDSINRIVEKYGINRRMINFEITESIAASDYDTLSHVIQRLREEGFLFSMDDYGTGYSNVSNIFSLNFDVIKIDKSLLWGAEKSTMGMVILENTIRMIRQMEKKILVEGVETLAQIKLLENLKVDYLQGYYFSKPIPKKDFIALISAYKKKEEPSSI